MLPLTHFISHPYFQIQTITNYREHMTLSIHPPNRRLLESLKKIFLKNKRLPRRSSRSSFPCPLSLWDKHLYVLGNLVRLAHATIDLLRFRGFSVPGCYPKRDMLLWFVYKFFIFLPFHGSNWMRSLFGSLNSIKVAVLVSACLMIIIFCSSLYFPTFFFYYASLVSCVVCICRIILLFFPWI